MVDYLRKKDDTIKLCVIVARESSVLGKEYDDSIMQQFHTCDQYASQTGLAIYNRYQDAAKSGASLIGRDGMESAIRDIREGRASVLVCASFARYSRDEQDQWDIRRRVERAGGEVRFADFQFDNSPAGDLSFSVVGATQAYQRREMREKMIRYKKHYAAKGNMTLRQPPFGYIIVTKRHVIRDEFPPGAEGTYIIDELTAPIAQRIFEEYASGFSMAQIANRLNDEGISTPRGGQQWRSRTLVEMLRNEVYVGRPRYGKTSNWLDHGRLKETNPLTGHPYVSPRANRFTDREQQIEMSAPALVSQELWDKVQYRLAHARRSRAGRPSQVRLCSGLIRCPRCGGTMTVFTQQSGKYRHYVCSHRVRKYQREGQVDCDKTFYPLPDTERGVAEVIIDLCKRPDAILAALTVYSKPLQDLPAPSTIRKQLSAIERRLKELEAKELATAEAQIQAIGAGGRIDPYLSILADIAVQRKDIEDQRGRLSKQLYQVRPGTAQADSLQLDVPQELLRDAQRVFGSENIPAVDKRNMLSLIVDRVVPVRGGARLEFIPGVLRDLAVYQGEPSTCQVLPASQFPG